MAPNSKYVGDPQIRNWNPWQLIFWLIGGEDPTWGTRSIDQVTLGLAIHEFATKVTDEPARKAIKAAAATVIAKNANAVAGESM
jgi:hypothetical protein